MKTHNLHLWDITPKNAKSIQKNLCPCIITEGNCCSPKYVARIQVFTSKLDENRRTVQSIVTITSPLSSQLLERKVAIKTSSFPSSQGLASFQVGPSIIAALNKLNRTPDLIICDGRGITGSLYFGVASHIGLVTNIPTVGVKACKPIEFPTTLGKNRGNWLNVAKVSQLSAVVTVIDNQDPVLVSPAHKIGLASAIEQVLAYVPANLPAKEYLNLLYPNVDSIEKSIPNLRLIKNN